MASSIAVSTSRTATLVSALRASASATPLSSEIWAACSVQRRVRLEVDTRWRSSCWITTWACSSRTCTLGSSVSIGAPPPRVSNTAAPTCLRSCDRIISALAPTRRARSRSASVWYHADSSTTGTRASRGSRRTSRQSWKPSTSGISTSLTMTSGRLARALRSAAAALAATVTSKPLCSK